MRYSNTPRKSAEHAAAETMSTSLKAPGSDRSGTGRFIPNAPATTPKTPTANVALDITRSILISAFRWLSKLISARSSVSSTASRSSASRAKEKSTCM